jgi:hypothetical protein
MRKGLNVVMLVSTGEGNDDFPKDLFGASSAGDIFEPLKKSADFPPHKPITVAINFERNNAKAIYKDIRLSVQLFGRHLDSRTL